jgi:hypothetical protein
MRAFRTSLILGGLTALISTTLGVLAAWRWCATGTRAQPDRHHPDRADPRARGGAGGGAASLPQLHRGRAQLLPMLLAGMSSSPCPS